MGAPDRFASGVTAIGWLKTRRNVRRVSTKRMLCHPRREAIGGLLAILELKIMTSLAKD